MAGDERVGRVNPSVIELDFAFVRDVNAGENLSERAFARAVFADDNTPGKRLVICLKVRKDIGGYILCCSSTLKRELQLRAGGSCWSSTFSLLVPAQRGIKRLALATLSSFACEKRAVAGHIMFGGPFPTLLAAIRVDWS